MTKLSLSLALVFAVALAGCLERFDGPEGFRCDGDEQCGPDLVCLKNTCQVRPANAAPFPWRMATYFGEYPFKWGTPPDDTHFTPSLGKYDSLEVLSNHLSAFAYGHLSIALFNWWGPGSGSDSKLQQALSSSAESPLLWAALYADEPSNHPTTLQIQSVLASFTASVAGKANYLHRDGLPVLFVDANASTVPCEVAGRWVPANANGGSPRVWLVLPGKPGGGQASCANQPQAWFVQDSMTGTASIAGAFTVTPGRWDYSEGAAALPRSLSTFRANVRAMVESQANIQLVTTFNNWAEGTAVESAQEWSSASGFGLYLDALHELLPE